MTREEVYESLCYRDERSPCHNPDYEKDDKCFCDNCFYRRHELAIEILRLMDKLEENYE